MSIFCSHKRWIDPTYNFFNYNIETNIELYILPNNYGKLNKNNGFSDCLIKIT